MLAGQLSPTMVAMPGKADHTSSMPVGASVPTLSDDFSLNFQAVSASVSSSKDSDSMQRLHCLLLRYAQLTNVNDLNPKQAHRIVKRRLQRLRRGERLNSRTAA